MIVGLTIGFRRGDADFNEGLYVNIQIDDEGIVLDELNTRYEAGVGSDHFTVPYCTLTPGQGFDAVDFERWMEKFAEVRAEDDVALRTTRDHI